LIKPNVLE